MISLFVVVYVWQNIEMMKLKMDYRRLVNSAKEAAESNDKLKYEFERLRNFTRIESNADKNGVREIGPADLVVIKIDEAPRDGNNENK